MPPLPRNDPNSFMKISKIEIKNIGPVEDVSVNVDKPLLLFYGDIQQGKSTLLNAIRWACGGSFPDDIIRHGADEAGIKITTDNGSITRTFYRAKDGSTKARTIQFVRDGSVVGGATEELKKLLNPFVVDQDFLISKSNPERARYFAQLFGITNAHKAEIQTLQNAAADLRSELRGFGDLVSEPEPVLIDTTAVLAEAAKRRSDHAAAVAAADKQNADAETRANSRNNAIASHDQRLIQITALQKQIAELESANTRGQQYLAEFPSLPLAPVPSPLDTSDLDAKITQAAVAAALRKTWEANEARIKLKATKTTALAEKEAAIDKLREKQLAELKEKNDSLGVPMLAFKSDGDFTYDGTASDMLSTSQLMNLSQALSSLYPAGLSVGLVDRAESLGTSVFALVERAKASDLNILATVVGERPATVPEEVGVFIVAAGKVTA